MPGERPAGRRAYGAGPGAGWVVGGGGGGGAVVAGAGGFGAGACWNPSPPVFVFAVVVGDTPDVE